VLGRVLGQKQTGNKLVDLGATWKTKVSTPIVLPGFNGPAMTHVKNPGLWNSGLNAPYEQYI
jgi:hypothetical protein